MGVELAGAAMGSQAARFRLAPPRRFLLPALLLLLSERPGHGYGLLPALQAFGFGHVDRPAVYRTLAQLEHDGLVEASGQPPTAGQARRVYRVTPAGQEALRTWMGVIGEEHEHLGAVLRRYRATETTDAVLATARDARRFGRSLHLEPTTGRRRLTPVACRDGAGTPRRAPSGPARFGFVAERSAVLIDVRTAAGRRTYGAVGVVGWVDAEVAGDVVAGPVCGRADIDLSVLSSGNRAYDLAFGRCLEVQRFPTAWLDVVGSGADPGAGPTGRGCLLAGRLTIHGVSRPARRGATLLAIGEGRLVVTADERLDLRDFAVASPPGATLAIGTDLRVRLRAEADLGAPR